MIPQSRLTLDRPDIWQRGVALASGLTGYTYSPKLPLADGTILACGFGYYHPPTSKSPEQIKRERIIEIDELLERHKKDIEYHREEIERLKKERVELVAAPIVLVPEGAMEWLLHEVGHWVAATPDERALPDYGYSTFKRGSGHGDAREWQAWAFEEIVLAPFGQSRTFIPPSYRGGTAFRKGEAIPQSAFSRIERVTKDENIAIEAFREIWADWVKYGKSLGPEAPWLT